MPRPQKQFVANMSRESEARRQAPLYRVGLSSGIYKPVEPNSITSYVQDVVVPDNDGLLQKVEQPASMSGKDHAALLGKLVGVGFVVADQEFAVGPVTDPRGHSLPQKMRVVEYRSRPSR